MHDRTMEAATEQGEGIPTYAAARSTQRESTDAVYSACGEGGARSLYPDRTLPRRCRHDRGSKIVLGGLLCSENYLIEQGRLGYTEVRCVEVAPLSGYLSLLQSRAAQSREVNCNHRAIMFWFAAARESNG